MKSLKTCMVLVLIFVLLGTAQVPFTATSSSGGGEVRGPVPMADDPVWTDGLDDQSHVYVPDGGLVNVEVSGGEARLGTGAVDGWIASSIITCPAGYRYDLVYLEVVLPGASYVQLSVLNASKESTEIGFANETIAPHSKVRATDHSVYDISPGYYPQMRIQVNLIASGTDRPRLLAWSLLYVALDEWHDDFLGTAKLSRTYGVNVTQGALEINLSRKGGGGGGEIVYDDFPPVFFPGGGDSASSPVYYSNAQGTGYDDASAFQYHGLNHALFADLNGDGNLDMVCCNYGYGGNPIPSEILWGDGTGTWTDAEASHLDTDRGNRVAFGDVNGDGGDDLVFACGGTDGSCVFYNNGNGNFSFTPDVLFAGKVYPYLDCGDVSGDGIDDIVFTWENKCDIYYGGTEGPDTTVDLTLTRAGGTSSYGVIVADLNEDGFDDVSFGGEVMDKLPIYLGGPTGLDANMDIQLEVGSYSTRPEVGDMNGDGYKELVCSGTTSGSGYGLLIFEGTASGWSDAKCHQLAFGGGWANHLRMLDINNDGYDDVLCPVGSDFRMYLGGSTWPTGPTATKSGAGNSQISIAVPAGFSGAIGGGFVTMNINLQTGQKWDILYLEGTLPKNTTAVISILDDKGRAIHGYEHVTGLDVDLQGILPSQYWTIRVKVNMRTEINNTTPRLDRITVKWIPLGTWREQFYGAAKVERTLNLDVAGGGLTRATGRGAGPQLLVTSLRSDSGYDTGPHLFTDGGGFDYAALPPLLFDAKGAAAVDAADIDGDGFMDVAFAVRQRGDTAYAGSSPLFLGSAVGWKVAPDHAFPTTGATDVLLRDLNGDGRIDVAFAQEQDGTTYRVNSTVFWGLEGGGWNATPDLELGTNGATGVAAADMDGDGDLDLAFSCYRDASSTTTSSMAFLQSATGFCGTAPSYLLPTKGASAVAAGDANKDGITDLAFANSGSGGLAEIDSYVYLGKAGGGFETSPLALRTSGAEDVELADLDGDGDLDLVFANQRNNLASYRVDSYVFLNGGTGDFPASPSVRFPTTGAVAVAVADLDGTGPKDLAFACQWDGSSYNVSTVVHLGGATGWSATPDVAVPTVGASDVLVAHLLKAGQGGYMSRPITPEDPYETGNFHTLRYTATVGAEQTGKVELVDATTWAPLAETALLTGTHEWVVEDAFRFREHNSVMVVVTVSGLDRAGPFSLDELHLNWTARVKLVPRVLGIDVSPGVLPRLTTGAVALNVTDEYDLTKDLLVTLEHRLNGTATWSATMFRGGLTFSSGAWRAVVFPKADALVGVYDLRVQAMDMDRMYSGYVVFPAALEVRNNVPTAPVIRISPDSPTTALTMQVSILTPSRDVESIALTYRYAWYLDGALQPSSTGDTVSASLTERGQNWSVEVRAFDGLDESPPAVAWVLIVNAPPQVKTPLPGPEIPEDTVDDQWLDLSRAFEDADGDVLAYSVVAQGEHIQVTIDPATGKVTLRPNADWNGQESATFVATDGALSAQQTVLITVTPVNDAPRFTTVNGGAITGDPVHLEVDQGAVLTITMGAEDVEGDELVFQANSTAVEVDDRTGTITFRPGNEAVGTLRFALAMYDVVSQDAKVRLNFTITVRNVNDPPGTPVITSPRSGARFKTNVTFALIGTCTDPDTVFGQGLNYSWWRNGTNLIGYESSLTTNFTAAGTYSITLTVTDGEFTRSVSEEVTIEPKDIPAPPPPPPPDDGDDEGTPYGLITGIVILLAIIIIVVFFIVTRRRADRLEAQDEVEEKRDAFKQMAEAVKETADKLEAEMAESKAKEEIVIEQVGSGASAVGATSARAGELSMAPKESEAPSADVQRLFQDVGWQEMDEEPTEVEEALRLENLKRKYQTAIGRLPYGIPAAALKDKDWNWLASALATGERKTLPDGREVTKVEGHWYYTDVKDASSFLTEHGGRPRAEAQRKEAPPSAAPSVDRKTLLAKLEERFIMGEISESRYEELRKKYGGE